MEPVPWPPTCPNQMAQSPGQAGTPWPSCSPLPQPTVPGSWCQVTRTVALAHDSPMLPLRKEPRARAYFSSSLRILKLAYVANVALSLKSLASIRRWCVSGARGRTRRQSPTERRGGDTTSPCQHGDCRPRCNAISLLGGSGRGGSPKPTPLACWTLIFHHAQKTTSHPLKYWVAKTTAGLTGQDALITCSPFPACTYPLSLAGGDACKLIRAEATFSFRLCTVPRQQALVCMQGS